MTTPTDAVPPSMPSQDDRVLAACAHLSFLAGFWLIAPIAIYVAKRKESHFVAFTALQAVVVQLLFGGGVLGGGIFFILFAAVAAGMSGRHEVVGVLAAFVPVLVMLAGAFALLLVHAYAAYTAWRGVTLTIPVAGQIARAIQNADTGAIKPGAPTPAPVAAR